MVRKTGLSGRGCSGAVLAGRLTPMSTVASGAATMKMMSSTSMTSMNGVTLISCNTSRSSLSPREPRRIAMVSLRGSGQRHGVASRPAADHQQELRRGIAKQCAVAGNDPREMVIDDDRRDRGDEAERGREQGLRNARRHHCEIGGVGLGDADEGVH